jgi:hypothetical protein
MIGDLNMQEQSRQQGMKFYPKAAPPLEAEIVGYTHGLPRAVYECLRRPKLSPYEMSIGVKTFKLASCMGCTFFMIANGYEPSASHLGGSLSWMPLYHGEGHIYDPTEPINPSWSPFEKQIWAGLTADELNGRIRGANETWADCMTKWMTSGAKALSQSVKADIESVQSEHRVSVDSLNTLLKTSDTNCVDNLKQSNKFTCCNLLLDALTIHKKDVDRVLATLRWGKGKAEPKIETDGFKWLAGPPNLGVNYMDLDKKQPYQNPLDNLEVKGLKNLAALDARAKGA